ncbi:ArsA family ATPase [Aciditerrimonas ferrireducens]|uniref:ArsA family ATPase n=1 Tax=Aciditerrimonas ferrireducens TaxID=667306 RepID=A0ABV6C2Q6_9ACTN
MPVPGLLDRRLLFVTGKGGVGKTTVACALALLGAGEGRRTLLCEVDAKGDVTAQLEVDPVGFEAREVLGGLWAMAMDTEASLREYLRLQLKVPIVGRIGPLAKAFDFVATAAPGVKEILTVGKFCYEVRENHYDLVVVDASATGHVVGQLSAPQAINELVKVGLVRTQTDWMLALLSDPAVTGLVVVTTPEEMPVNETLELAERVRRETTVTLCAVVANRVLPELFGAGEEEVFETLRQAAGRRALRRLVPGDPEPVLEAARLAVTLRRTRAEHLARLRAGLPVGVQLAYVPELFTRSHGRRQVRRVAQHLAEELVT